MLVDGQRFGQFRCGRWKHHAANATRGRSGWEHSSDLQPLVPYGGRREPGTGSICRGASFDGADLVAVEEIGPATPIAEVLPSDGPGWT